MKTLLLFILLFLGGVLFFGCKKNKPTFLDVLESQVAGTYLVSGSYYSYGPTVAYNETYPVTNDTFTFSNAKYSYSPQNSGGNLYCFTYSYENNSYPVEYDTIWFLKSNLDSVQMHFVQESLATTDDYYLSGTKIH